MNHRVKRFLFKWYALISVIALFIAALSLLPFCKWKPFLAVAGVILSFAFGIQKQNLEETKLFKDLFEQFNNRYDGMNDELNEIYKRAPDVPLNEKEIKALFKYFNLCGEEFFYFEKGFIGPEVWHAWKNGMKYFRRNSRISTLWDEELKSGSYYGLSFKICEQNGCCGY